jgi:hypothetical protein
VDAGILHNLYVKFKEEERPREGQGISLARLLGDMKQQMSEWHKIMIDGQVLDAVGVGCCRCCQVLDAVGARCCRCWLLSVLVSAP